MGAQALPHDIAEPMPESSVELSASAQTSYKPESADIGIVPLKLSHWHKLVFILPVLAATTLAATITSLTLSQERLFTLLCGEIGLGVFSVFISVPRSRNTATK